MYYDKALKRIDVEYVAATLKFSSFHSPHEGLAVIEEEFDELKAEVFKNPEVRRVELMEKEASHVAAMALRFLIDLC